MYLARNEIIRRLGSLLRSIRMRIAAVASLEEHSNSLLEPRHSSAVSSSVALHVLSMR